MNCLEEVARDAAVCPGFVDIECHLKWLYEFFGFIPQEVLRTAGSEVKHISSLLQSDRLSEESENLFRRVTDLCWKLNLAAQYTFLKDFNSALKCIKMAKDELEFHVKSADAEPSSSHLAVYNYMIDASTLMVVRQILETNGLSDVSIVVSSEELVRQWEDLMLDDRSKAAVMFSKACLGSSLRIDESMVIKNLKEAAALEPDFHGWYRYIYRKSRQIRRNGMMRRYSAPSAEEKKACNAAYKLRPDVGDNIANMANMLEETLHAERHSMDKEEITERLTHMIDLLKNSLKLLNDPWVKVRLAEIYGYGGYSQLDASEGEKLFQECIEEWPLNTMAWHKAGKFYSLGGNSKGNGPFRKPEKAKEYFKRALQLRASNFPCLMDLLKLLRDPLDAIDEIVETIDKSIPMLKKETEHRKLLTTKGLILWVNTMDKQGRREACVAWIQVVDRFPDSASDVAYAIKGKRNEIVGLLDINVDEVIALLEQIKDELPVNETVVSYANLIAELKKTRRVSKDNGANNGIKKTSTDQGKVADGDEGSAAKVGKDDGKSVRFLEEKISDLTVKAPEADSTFDFTAAKDEVNTPKAIPRGRGRLVRVES